MTFRQSKSDAQRVHKEWRDWIDDHRAELFAIGLPPEVFFDKAHWVDFLQNGHMHWHESSGFEFGDLSPGQLGALHRFLEHEYGSDEHEPPLLNWVRIRCGSK